MKFEKSYTFVKKNVVVYEWKINEISSYIEKDGDDVLYKLNLDSPKFTTGSDEEKNWYFRLRSENANKSWLSLNLKYSSAKRLNVKTKYILFVLNNKNERVNVFEFKKWFKNDSDGWNCAEFLKKADLEEKKDVLLPNDTLTIGVELTVYDDPVTYSNSVTFQKASSYMAADYRRLFESKEGCDFVFNIKGQTFKVHKTILMARSEMFLKMFTLEMKESKEKSTNLFDIKPQVFKSLLEFIYTDEVTDIDVVVEDLLEAADKYLLNSLKDLCAETLIKMLRIDNAVRFLSLAENHNCTELSEHVSEFIIYNLEDVMKTPEFKVMSVSNPSLALPLLRKFVALKTSGAVLISSTTNNDEK